jgi:DNA-binding NarL/FixJ family response regulator
VRSERDTGSPIRVVLAEDNVLVREGLLRILEAEPDIRVVATSPDLDSLYRMVDQLDPDVVVTDIRMPPAPMRASRRRWSCAGARPGLVS